MELPGNLEHSAEKEGGVRRVAWHVWLESSEQEKGNKTKSRCEKPGVRSCGTGSSQLWPLGPNLHYHLPLEIKSNGNTIKPICLYFVYG